MLQLFLAKFILYFLTKSAQLDQKFLMWHVCQASTTILIAFL